MQRSARGGVVQEHRLDLITHLRIVTALGCDELRTRRLGATEGFIEDAFSLFSADLFGSCGVFGVLSQPSDSVGVRRLSGSGGKVVTCPAAPVYRVPRSALRSVGR